jgi:hypothetical protein
MRKVGKRVVTNKESKAAILQAISTIQQPVARPERYFSVLLLIRGAEMEAPV